MSTDLSVLCAVGLFSMVLAFLPGIGRIARGGLAWGTGNRDKEPEDTPDWVARAERAHRNLLENLPLFTIIVLVAHVTGRADETTASAALTFLAARVVHAAVYIGGITHVRTLAFYVGLAAELVMLWRIFA